MVKRISDLRFKREKKIRISRTEEYVINTRYLGEEPKFTSDVDDVQLSKAFTWYSYMCSASDARDYIMDYMERIGKKKVALLVKQISDSRIPVTAGWLCRIMVRGGKISNRSKEFLLDRVTRAIERSQQAEVEEKKSEKPTRPAVDVQASVREKARDIIGDIESMIDNGEKFSIYEHMQKKSIPAVYANYISEYYSKMVAELEEVLSGDDPDLREAYRHQTKSQVKKQLEFYRAIVDGARQFTDNVKRVRKANSKPKTVSVEKLIKNLRYQKNDQEFKLVSIDPQKILAAQELWTFNTKNRMLTVYRAQDQGGLGVKTVNVTGFSESTSFTKKLRRPEETLQKVLTGGKVVLRELMDKLTTKAGVVKGRLTSETILLRVV